jgi:hypothetical protein
MATGAPVPGAKVTVTQGGATLGSELTGPEGQYVLTFKVPLRPQSQTVTLLVERTDYVGKSVEVVVTPSGAAEKTSYRFELLPAAVAECYHPRDHTIIVGYFRPPASASGDADFASRIRDNVHLTLLPVLQELAAFKDQPSLQPEARDCAQARPKREADYPGFAKALGADAFLTGYVAPAGRLFKVEMWVADRFDLLIPPSRATSANMDLDDPDATRLSVPSRTAILSALAVGYEKTGKTAECVQVAEAAQRILKTMPPEIAATRKRCQAALGHQGLLRGATP